MKIQIFFMHNIFSNMKVLYVLVKDICLICLMCKHVTCTCQIWSISLFLLRHFVILFIQYLILKKLIFWLIFIVAYCNYEQYFKRIFYKSPLLTKLLLNSLVLNYTSAQNRTNTTGTKIFLLKNSSLIRFVYFRK